MREESEMDIIQKITEELNVMKWQVEAAVKLINEGCTIPFISRYRKEKTGNMDEVNIEAIAQANEKLKEMAKRKETILKTIDEQGKLTDALKERIENCWDATELEDIYLPFKPKRRTRAQIAREAGLEPLAQVLLFQRERNPLQAAKKFVSDKVKDADAALQDIAELFALMWVVRVSAAAGFQRDEDWLHHVFLRVRDDPADLIFQLRIVFFKIVSLSEYDLLLRCFIKKLTEGGAEALQDVGERRDRGRGQVAFQLGYESLGKLCPVRKLLLCQTLQGPYLLQL